MTLRDIGNTIGGWIEAGADAIERDLRVVFSEHVLDWPLWTLLAAGVLAYVALIAAVGFLVWLVEFAAYLARRHQDQDGRSRLGIVIAARSFASAVLRLILLPLAFFAFALWFMAVGHLATGQWPVWLSIPIIISGVLICAALVIAARRGRRLRRLETRGGASGE